MIIFEKSNPSLAFTKMIIFHFHFPITFSVLSNSALTANLFQRPPSTTAHPTLPPPQLRHNLPSSLLRPLPHLQELWMSQNGRKRPVSDATQAQTTDRRRLPKHRLGSRYVFFWFVSSFYDLTWYPWSSFFLGSILPVTTGVEVAQPTPTASHPSPHPNGMRGFSVMLRRAGRGTRRPVEGTVGDSSGKHQKITLLLPRHSYMAANPVQNIDPAVSSPTSQQWPKSPNDNPSQPHERLLVGCITGGTTTVPLHNSGNNKGRQPTHHPPPASRATACGVIVGGMMLPPTWYPGLWAIAHRVQMGRVGDSVVTGRPFFCRYFVSSI